MCQVRISCWRPRPRAVYNFLQAAESSRMMVRMFFFTILQGLSAGLRIQESPLYRYPYRSAEQAFRGDAKRIRGDIEASLERGHE